MLIITNEKLGPALVDVKNRTDIRDLLLESINEYIFEQAKKTIVRSIPQTVFHVSGLSEYHHQRLRDYLNHLILQDHSDKANLKTGTFAGFPTNHYWLSIGDLILDVTIKQFADKPINLHENIKQDLDKYCFLSDNTDNYIYKLYQSI